MFPLRATGTWTSDPVYDSVENVTRFTDANAHFTTNSLVGRLINPDATQPRQVYILANTATTIDVASKMCTNPYLQPDDIFVASGDTYQFMDYHIPRNSPAVDVGASSGAPATDLEGAPRPIDIVGQGNEATTSTYDLGAYEVQDTTLTVLSSVNSCDPSVGNHAIGLGVPLTARALSPLPIASGIRQFCTGYTGLGAAPDHGSTDAVTFFFDRPSTITWLWTTQYELSTETDPPSGGRIVLDDNVTTAAGWYTPGAVLNVKAIAADGYTFNHWSGADSGSSMPVALMLSTPLELIAHFDPAPTPLPTEAPSPTPPPTVSPTVAPSPTGSRVNDWSMRVAP